MSIKVDFIIREVVDQVCLVTRELPDNYTEAELDEARESAEMEVRNAPEEQTWCSNAEETGIWCTEMQFPDHIEEC